MSASMSAGPGRVIVAGLLCAAFAVGGCSARSAKEAAKEAADDVGAAGGAAFGAVTGFIAGSLIGRLLDPDDRAKQQTATQRSLSDSETIRWNSDANKGVHGYSETVDDITVPSFRQGGESGGGCRSVREVAYVDGREYVEMVEYCRAAGASGWTRKVA